MRVRPARNILLPRLIPLLNCRQVNRQASLLVDDVAIQTPVAEIHHLRNELFPEVVAVMSTVVIMGQVLAAPILM